MTCKIVVVGVIEGRFEVFEKLSKLHHKNNFSVGLALGDLFADPSTTSEQTEEALTALLNGKINIPFPLYFTLGKFALPENVKSKLEQSDGEVCPNLFYLGKRSVTKTSEGIRIVAIGGSLDPALPAAESKDKYLPFHTETDVKTLSGAHSTDILISTNWPTNVRLASNVNLSGEGQEPPNESCLADLCSRLRPRYYLSSSPQFFYEREPFSHTHNSKTSDPPLVTRFISMAAFGNSTKQKSIYAFSIDPSVTSTGTLPPNTTVSPFATNKRKRHADEYQPQQNRHFPRHHDLSYHRGQERPRRPPPSPESCFFCLSNPNVATHLITSIGNDSYLTTAKGPLTTSKTFPALAFPAHMLIIPLSHSPTFASISPSETAMSTYQEMQRYRKSLQSLVSVTSKGALGAVTWEISRTYGIHIHWQFLPVPADLISQGLVEAGFKVEAENEQYESFKEEDVGDGSSEEDFLRVWLWRPSELGLSDVAGQLGKGGDGHEKSLILRMTRDIRFNLQFPRKVMAKLLGLEGRLQWQDCAQNDEEETAEAKSFKEAFEPFDFTLKEA